MLDGIDDLAHRQHDAAQFDEILAQPVGLALQIAALGGPLLEQFVLEVFDLVVEFLHGFEVAVDDDVEQAVHQGADAVLLAAEFVEALRDGVDVEFGGGQSHGDQPRGSTNPEMRWIDSLEPSSSGASETA